MSNFDLDTVLLEIADSKGVTPWTIRDSVEGTQIFGGIGSGKTSASARKIALKFLEAGFGGLVLTAKESEKNMWIQYCQSTGRSDDLIIIEPGKHQRFNFLEYESTNGVNGDSYSANIVNVLKTVIEAGEEKKGGRSDDAFWENAQDMLMHNVIDLCKLAYGKVSLQKIYDIAITAPKRIAADTSGQNKAEGKNKAFHTAIFQAKKMVDAKAEEWFESLSPSVQQTLLDPDAFGDAVAEVIPEARLLRSIDQFFSETYSNLSEKTRSTIEFSFTGFLFRLLQEPFYSLFCNRPSTVTPDDCLKGKIILLNIPVKRYHNVGRDCQIMFKYIWQRAMEKRNLKENARPIFLFADEAQHFIHRHDSDYQATARSSRIATVYITQNLPNYHANMGSEKSEYRVKSFMGTLATKIFHANADIETNKYASELIGEAYTEEITKSVTVSAGNMSETENSSWKLEKMVRPEQFTGLLTGGPANNMVVGAYIHKQGKPFHTTQNFLEVKFLQETKFKAKTT